jgi:hypothetical protein
MAKAVPAKKFMIILLIIICICNSVWARCGKRIRYSENDENRLMFWPHRSRMSDALQAAPGIIHAAPRPLGTEHMVGSAEKQDIK